MRELQPFRPTRTRPWDRATARHLLERAAFGGTTADVDEVVDLGPEDSVARLIDYPERGPEPPPEFVAIDLDPGELRALNQEERRKRALQLQRQQRQAVVGLKAWWLGRMITTDHPLEEKLTLFWHGHFATEADKVKSARMLYDQNELLRTQGRGAFGDLLLAIGRDPAMLIYLDNHLNRRGHANENYARELFELFSLGIGTYTEADVLEAARALTGWTLDRRRLYTGGTGADFKPAMHDDGEKTVLGRSGDFGDQEIVGLILQQPSTPGFIVRKLWRFFVADEVAEEDEPILDYLARELRNSGYQVGAALRELLLSHTFYDEHRFGTRIKSPVELLVGTARRLDQAPEDYVVKLLSAALRGLGQDLFDPPNVAGWHGGREWINTSTLLQRYNVVGTMLLGMRRRRRQPGPSLIETFADLETSDAGAIVDGLAQHLLAAPLDGAGRQELVGLVADVLAGGGGAEEAVRTAAHLLTSTPQYQLC
jgi:hypothetical protein